MVDALVVGAGPAGIALAAALAQCGLTVTGIAPAPPDAPWPHTYGIWADELDRLALPDLLRRRWPAPVAFPTSDAVVLDRAYGLIDNAKLQAHLLAQGMQGGVAWIQDHVTGFRHDAQVTQVTTATGATLTARVVIDAGGHAPALVQRPAGAPVAYQAAYGLVGRFARPPVSPGSMILMDFRTDHLPASERTGPPTFLYAMDLGDDVYFVEETSLAHVPAVPLATLEARLHRRLAACNAPVISTHHIERCLFPMNLPLPDLRQPVLGFGGAGGLVHPATGYSVGASLRAAPSVAAALAAALRNPDATPAQIAAAGWRALWPADRVRRRHLYLFGLKAMLRFDAAQTQAFFAAFFALPHDRWAGYLADTLTTPQLLAVMGRVFATAPMSVRRSLIGAAFAPDSVLWAARRRG